jgi:hypothetical protein
MLRRAIPVLLFASAFAGAADRLYLKDGDYQLVREYQVQQDRVRYYSTERSDWEEIPLELVDLERTKKEATEQEVIAKEANKVVEEENAAIRAERKLIQSIPADPGVYYLRGEKMETIKIAEPKINNSTKRTVLRMVAPIPLPGKVTIELDGLASANKMESREPEFYFRLSEDQSFGIVKLTLKKDARVVESATVMQVKQDRAVDEKVEILPAFKKQEGDLLYKIWPEKPLEPGEYALIEYTEGKLAPRVWDFSVK